jgi:hypothetical protein
MYISVARKSYLRLISKLWTRRTFTRPGAFRLAAESPGFSKNYLDQPAGRATKSSLNSEVNCSKRT